MKLSFTSTFLTRMRSATRRLRRDQRGIAAVEFAMIAPVMFFLFAGTIEMSQAITVDRRVTQIASSTADLVAREKQITDAQLLSIANIADVLMRPYDPSKLKLTLVSVGAKTGVTPVATTKVCWSYNYRGGVHTYANQQTYALPNNAIIDAGGSVVVAEVTYDYTPLIFHYFITSTTKLSDKFFLKPRVSSMIQKNADALCTVN